MRDRLSIEACLSGINEDSEVNRKRRKKWCEKQTEKKRNDDFHCMAKHVGRGANGSLRMLHKKDEEGRAAKTHAARKAIEEEAMSHNQKRFAMAARKKLHQDKTHAKLGCRVAGKKALEVRLDRMNCGSKEALEFLQLPKRLASTPANDFNPAGKEDWSRAVKNLRNGAHLPSFQKKSTQCMK